MAEIPRILPPAVSLEYLKKREAGIELTVEQMIACAEAYLGPNGGFIVDGQLVRTPLPTGADSKVEESLRK